MPVNILNQEEAIAGLLSLIGQPARIRLLLAIGAQEACVCHLEAALGMRQASISQHLMALRKAGLVTASRDGRNIFYRLARPEILTLLYQAAEVCGAHPEEFQRHSARPVSSCPCPRCTMASGAAQGCSDSSSAPVSRHARTA